MVLTREEKNKLSDLYIKRVLDPGEKPLQLSIQQFFKGQKARNLSLVGDWHPGKDLQLSKSSEATKIRAMFAPHYKRQAERALRHAAEQINRIVSKSIVLKDGEPLTIESSKDEIRRVVAERLKFISSINDTTFKRIEDKVAAAIADGTSRELSNAQIADLIKGAMGDEYDRRGANAMMIARTETGTITSQIQYGAGKKYGGLDKGWLSTRDELVREDHRLADEQGFISYEAEFTAPEMLYPLDPAGDADEVINCRCAIIYAEAK